MSAATPRWAIEPGGASSRAVDPGEVLVDLLGLVDALPPVERTPLSFPPFRTFVGHRTP